MRLSFREMSNKFTTVKIYHDFMNLDDLGVHSVCEVEFYGDKKELYENRFEKILQKELGSANSERRKEVKNLKSELSKLEVGWFKNKSKANYLKEKIDMYTGDMVFPNGYHKYVAANEVVVRYKGARVSEPDGNTAIYLLS